MSTDTDADGIGEHEARQKAEIERREKLGNIPRLGEGSVEEDEYVYPIITRYPQVVLDEEGEEVIDVRYLSERNVGEIRVNNEGEIDHRPDVWDVRRKIEAQKQHMEDAVQKALVSSTAQRFSQIPFAEMQYTPLLDILSKLIVEGRILQVDLDQLNIKDQERYRKYAEKLEEVGLVQLDEDELRPGDILIGITTRDSFEEETEARVERQSDPEMLNAALAHFFEAGADDIDSIREILGPHLHLSGHYYSRAIQIPEMPKIRESELRDALRSEYTPQKAEERIFKMPRYLIQLEEIGMLESTRAAGERVWVGKEEIRAEMLQKEYIDEVDEILATG